MISGENSTVVHYELKMNNHPEYRRTFVLNYVR